MGIRNKVSGQIHRFAKHMRKNPTYAETVLFQELKRASPHPVHSQKIMFGWIADCYIPAVGLIVEADGSSHDGRSDYDQNRDAQLLKRGFVTLRFTNEAILADPAGVAAKVVRFAEGLPLKRKPRKK